MKYDILLDSIEDASNSRNFFAAHDAVVDATLKCKPVARTSSSCCSAEDGTV